MAIKNMEDIEDHIAKVKHLRSIYEMILHLDPNIEIDYDGADYKLGDKVFMRSRRNVTLDTTLGGEGRGMLHQVLNRITWGCKASVVVILTNDRKFIMGFTKHED